MRVTEEVPMDPLLSKAYTDWISVHCKKCSAERRRRLEQKINHAEKLFIKNVWWPLFGQLGNLHPEFEVKDFKDGWRFLDFAYLISGCRIAIEIDGFGPHWRDINRHQFSDQLMRQNHLIVDGWLVLRFSYDDIAERPRACQQIIQQLIGRWTLRNGNGMTTLTALERLIFNIALSQSEPLTPAYATKLSGLHRSTVSRHLRTLKDKQVLLPSRMGAKRICSYLVNPSYTRL